MALNNSIITKLLLEPKDLDDNFVIVHKVRDIQLMVRFGENLKKVRRSRNFTQEYLAEEAGISQVQIARIEKGRLNTSISTVYALLKALKVEANELFGPDHLQEQD